MAHNKAGFRDIEHNDIDDRKPAIVFLGDSFTWGHEVEFDEMFVNRLRERLPTYEIFNLAHRGYGTDQELITFKSWHDNRPLKWVVLMFSPNDVADNDSSRRYSKPKPKFQLVDDKLVLTGVPVPMTEAWTRSRPAKPESWQTKLMRILFRSHTLHDIAFRVHGLFRSSKKESRPRSARKPVDLDLTAGILAEFKNAVESRGAKLIVFFIPSKSEIEGWDDSIPYQRAIADLCRRHGIEHFDLATAFKRTWFRNYHRQGAHWNAYGHQVAAEAIYTYLTRDLSP